MDGDGITDVNNPVFGLNFIRGLPPLQTGRLDAYC
jgi:hypothetical protein